MSDQVDTLTLKEVELDYEADEGDDLRADAESPTSFRGDDSRNEFSSPRTDDGDLTSDAKSARDSGGHAQHADDKDELESGEELEDGEISDEDETLRNERNEPKPVCRFYSKGQCTWGSSCRFLHPGVLDKGNYSMFATPRPILPGEPDKEQQPKEEEVEPVFQRPPAPAFETAWERGLRQAKEMRRRSHKRREMDVEYEEKKASLSLTQIELDKENDYYTRPASPAHTHDPYANEPDTDYADTDYADTFQPESRRIAPPPPADFVARGERSNNRRYSESPPPRVRRVAPPRSPSPSGAPPRDDSYRVQRFKGGEDWADPWMRSKDEKPRGRTRRRSYSSGSSRSSSRSSSSSRSASIRRSRRYSTSNSSRSSSRSQSDSRSRSSSPEGIPRRVSNNPGLPLPAKNTAPLQKRLAAVTGQHNKNNSASFGRVLLGVGANIKQEGEKKQSAGSSREQTKKERDRNSHNDSDSKQKEPFKMNIQKNQIKLTLKTATGKPANSGVLDKLGTNKDDLFSDKQRKRKLELDPTHPDSVKLKKLESQELMETLGQRLKANLEAKQAKEVEAKSLKAKNLQAVMANEKKVDNKDKKKKIAAGSGGEAEARRKEELRRQLRMVEKAIQKKRTKLEK